MRYHNPVLLKESVEGLITNPDGIYVDCTFGGGGHSREILKRISPTGRLFAFDQDQDAIQNSIDDPRFRLINQNFRFLANSLLALGIAEVHGVLADLGVSSHQFDEAERGFSTRADGPLDMRMNTLQPLSAKQVVNEYDEEQLADVLFWYGELKTSRKMAREIVDARKNGSLKTTTDLKKVFSYLPEYKSNKILAQVFQAIRIEVNQELEALKEMLQQSYQILVPGGRLSVISYHSLEDRLVKRFIRDGLFKGHQEPDVYGNYKKYFEVITKKAVVPEEKEIELNSRARSAKLRIGAKV